LLPNILPEYVTDISFDVLSTSSDEVILKALFGVSDYYWDSLDSINKAAFSHKVKMKLQNKINSYINIWVEFDRGLTTFIKQSDFPK
jgi:hypothetical protein